MVELVGPIFLNRVALAYVVMNVYHEHQNTNINYLTRSVVARTVRNTPLICHKAEQDRFRLDHLDRWAWHK